MLTLEKAYQILQVFPDASDEEIKKAYRARAKELHPDTNANDPFAEVNFQYLQEAMAKIEEDRKVSYNSARTEYQSQSSHQNTYSSNNKKNENYSEHTGGSNFASDRSAVLKRLNDVYSFVKKRKYRKIEEGTDCRELAYKCAYGTLLRHALECIVHDKAREIHVITEGRSSDELLSFIIDNYPFDVNTKKIFYDAKFITNKLTHIEHFSYSQITFESCQEFYNKRFKQIIEAHLSSNKKRTQSYLRKIYEQLENFDVKSRITSTLLLGSVMRQLLECIVDLWLYNENLVCEDKANIKDKLDVLRFYLQNAGSKQTYYTYSTLDNLHAIRIAVNQAMHVSPDNKMNISKIRSSLMAQTSNLDIEIEMPTEKQKRKVKNRFSWKKALLWIFFFPIMLAITIGKSKMGTLLKVILIYSCIQMAFGATIGIIGIIYESFDNGGVFDRPTIIEEKYQLEENDFGYTIHVLPEKASALSGIVEIPTEYDGTPITEIASKGFSNCTNVTSFIVPKSVTYIGEGAFEGCTSLQYITLPFVGQSKDATNEKAVLGYIFGCEEISVEFSVEEMGYDDRFVNEKPNDRSGQTWQYSWYNYGGIFEDTYYYSYYYSIPNSLTNIVITQQTDVPVAAFNGCKNLVSISYEAGISSIGEAAFQNCSKLTFASGELQISKNVIAIGDYAFAGCKGLTKVIVPQTVRTIGHAAFKDCDSLQSLTVPFVGHSEDATNEKAVLGYIFGYEEIPMEFSVEEMGYDDRFVNQKPDDRSGLTWQYSWYNYGGVFEDTYYSSYYYAIPDSLTNVVITQQTNVPVAAFNGCTKLTSITVPTGSTYGEAAFQNCNATVTNP